MDPANETQRAGASGGGGAAGSGGGGAAGSGGGGCSGRAKSASGSSGRGPRTVQVHWRRWSESGARMTSSCGQNLSTGERLAAALAAGARHSSSSQRPGVFERVAPVSKGVVVP